MPNHTYAAPIAAFLGLPSAPNRIDFAFLGRKFEYYQPGDGVLETLYTRWAGAARSVSEKKTDLEQAVAVLLMHRFRKGLKPEQVKETLRLARLKIEIAGAQ